MAWNGFFFPKLLLLRRNNIFLALYPKRSVVFWMIKCLFNGNVVLNNLYTSESTGALGISGGGGGVSMVEGICYSQFVICYSNSASRGFYRMFLFKCPNSNNHCDNQTDQRTLTFFQDQLWIFFGFHYVIIIYVDHVGSNRRPRACHASALATELMARQGLQM